MGLHPPVVQLFGQATIPSYSEQGAFCTYFARTAIPSCGNAEVDEQEGQGSSKMGLGVVQRGRLALATFPWREPVRDDCKYAEADTRLTWQ